MSRKRIRWRRWARAERMARVLFKRDLGSHMRWTDEGRAALWLAEHSEAERQAGEECPF